jgi:hypothetical protein
MKCPRCGFSNPHGIHICQNCEGQMAQSFASRPSTSHDTEFTVPIIQEEQPESKKKGNGLTILLVIVFMASIIGASAFFGMRGVF